MSADADLPLRNALDQILREYQTTAEQAAALEDLRSSHSHSIRPGTLADFCELGDGGTPEYDCFTFALDLIDCQERITAREYAPRKIGPIQRPGIADALPGPNFLQFLQLPKQTSLQGCHDYDLVVYYDKFGNAQHAGKIVGGMIVSKWGMKGALWQHGLWEVPSSYGTSVQFYSHRSREYIREQWLKYLYKLAQRVMGFTTLVSVMYENKGKNLNHEELLSLAAQKRAHP
jgi:hypothetical protein